MGNRCYSNIGDGQGREVLHRAFMATGLKIIYLQQLTALKKEDKKGWQGQGLFTNDPTDDPDYTAKVNVREAVWIDRLQAIIHSEHPCDLLDSVARMFANGHTVHQDSAEATAHLNHCEILWRTSLCPVVEKEQQAWGEGQQETKTGHCVICKAMNLQLPAVGITCSECENLLGTGESDCYVFTSHTARAVLCAKCGVNSRRAHLSTDEWEVGGETFLSNQVHIVRASRLCGSKTEETVGCECGKWEHVACVAAVTPRLLDPTTDHACTDCLYNEPRFKTFKQLRPDDDPYRATKLPHAKTERATYLTRQLETYLDGKGVKDRFVVLETCRTVKVHDMSTPMRGFLKALGGQETEVEIRFRYSVLLMVHLDDTALMRDTMVAGINLHEYLSGPAKGTAYVGYLDSLNHVRSSARSPAIKGFFATVAKSAAVLGSSSLKLYALSPNGTKYIWWERPQDMLLAQDPVKQQKHLVQWYVPHRLSMYE